MREIKFRAWHKKKKLMRNVTSLVDIYHCSARAEIDKHTLEEWDFDDIELMQYTGLQDENGREIYEGDILSPNDEEDNSTGVVKYDNKRGSYYIDFENGSCVSNFDYAKFLEVIGNIYENPELMEENE